MSRKPEILDALIDIFNQKGIAADFTMSELARAVNIGKSTIYEYFQTKEEIVSEAIFRIFENSITEIRARFIDESKSFEYLLKDELRFIFKLAKESQFIFEFLQPENQENYIKNVRGEFANTMKDTINAYQALYIKIVQKGIEDGILGDDNLLIKGQLLAALVSGSITRIFNVHNGGMELIDLDQYINAMYDATVKIFN